MPDANAIIAAINAHCETLSDHDKDGWLALWADDTVLEDPVGVDTYTRYREPAHVVLEVGH